MQSLPLFPGLFDPPVEPAGGPPAGARRSDKGKRRGKADATAAPFDIAVPSLREGTAAQGERYARSGAAEAAAVAAAVVEAIVPALGSGPVAIELPETASVAASASATESISVSVTDSVSASVTETVSASASVTAWVTDAGTAVHLVAPPVQPRRSDRGVLVFDVETTGTDRKKDQVIELCMQRGLSGTDYKIWRFKPTVAISPGAEAVHGISMAQLADCPGFASCVDEIRAWFAAADVIVGYNLIFDIDMLQAEYERAGRPPLDLAAKAVVDPFRLWQQCEPRSLQHAHQRFVGQGFEAAHSASADVAATGRVLAGMIAAFGLDDHDWDGVATVCDPNRQNWVGPSRHLQWDGAVVVISFGKHAGHPLHVLASGEHSGYLRWVCDRDFPNHVAEVCARALELAGDADGFHGWIRARFGPPPADGASAARKPPAAVAPVGPATGVG